MADKMVQDKSTPGPVSGETKGALASGGESQGQRKPSAKSDKKPDFHGGQSEQGYYGGGQLGDRQVGEGSSNAPSESEDKE